MHGNCEEEDVSKGWVRKEGYSLSRAFIIRARTVNSAWKRG